MLQLLHRFQIQRISEMSLREGGFMWHNYYMQDILYDRLSLHCVPRRRIQHSRFFFFWLFINFIEIIAHSVLLCRALRHLNVLLYGFIVRPRWLCRVLHLVSTVYHTKSASACRCILRNAFNIINVPS